MEEKRTCTMKQIVFDSSEAIALEVDREGSRAVDPGGYVGERDILTEDESDFWAASRAAAQRIERTGLEISRLVFRGRQRNAEHQAQCNENRLLRHGRDTSWRHRSPPGTEG